MPKKVRIIVNPTSRAGRVRRELLPLRKCPPPGLQLEWRESQSAAHLGELVRAAQDEDLDAVALAGGDGTVALALEALGGPNRVPLAVLPGGTGNDFACQLGMPLDLPAAVASLAGGVVRQVDVARAEPGGPYCCVASAGLDELALRVVYRWGLPRSRLLYVLAAVWALGAYKPRRMRVSWEGGGFEGEVMFVAVTNTRSYAGGMLVTPDARLDDGQLDVCVVRRTSRMRLLWHFRTIMRGAHAQLPEITLASSPWVRLEALDGPMPVALDGEPPTAVTPVLVRCDPGALRLLVPAAAGALPQAKL